MRVGLRSLFVEIDDKKANDQLAGAGAQLPQGDSKTRYNSSVESSLLTRGTRGPCAPLFERSCLPPPIASRAVSKRRDAPYRSGKQCGWVKVKCATWREANRERWLFERTR
jgi:hypothetical protein